MPHALINTSTLPAALAVLGSAGSVVGGGVALVVSHSTLRQAFENLALGGAIGGVCGCLATFLAYLVIQILG
ncbi:MAG TPA: hypothetical protein VN845_05655 [Solirubrobacteraceae bacterium]|nr:hypothetical protein [Solirubrobacteraceae bacterium]